MSINTDEDYGIIRINLPTLCLILGVVFLIFKLVNILVWSWLWILAPFWIPIIYIIISLSILILGVAFKKE